MSFTDAVQQRYESDTILARYLEAEWSDFLFNDTSALPPQGFNPMTDRVKPTFYQEVRNLVKGWLQNNQITPSRYCDVGSATGRTVYELNQIINFKEIVLAEPSSKFCEWAKRLLTESTDLGWIPSIDNLLKPAYQKATSRPEPITKLLIHIYVCVAESVPRPANYFDLITCLNVADRHPYPKALVATLYDLLSPGGILVFSSPMDFSENYTPDKDRWVSNLNDLFSDTQWRTIGEDNIFYDFRAFNRRYQRYSSQVVGKQKI